MHLRSITRRGVLTAGAGALALVSAAVAQPKEQPDNQPKPFGSGTVFVLERGPLNQLLVDPKDRALSEALAMVPDRVRELQHQLPDMPPEAVGLINTVLSCVSRPARIAVTYNENPSGGAFGYGVILSFDAGGQEDADAISAQVNALLARARDEMGDEGPGFASKASKRWPTMSEIQLPVGVLSYGPRQAGKTWRYEVFFGTVEDPDAVTTALPEAPKGFDAFARASLDLRGLTPAVNMARSMVGGQPEALAGFQKMQDAGLFGDDAIKVNMVFGHTADATVSQSVVVGAARYREAWHLETEPLSKADLAAVPADASMVYLARNSLSWIGTILDEAAKAGAPVQEGLDQFAQQTGVDLRHDILEALGGTWGVYISESTGGGSIGSAVAMLTFKDRAKFAAAHTKLVAFANAMAEQAPLGPGAVRLVSWKDGDNELVSVRFPGLPVPLEITYALTKQWLIVAPTPQGAMAAARQASGKGDGGLMENKSFASAVPSSKQVVGVSFMDTSRHIGAGYPLVSMVGSAISNAVRSPTDPGREPGLIVPMYNDLKKNAAPAVSLVYWRGDDLVLESRSDRSMLVSTAGAIGAISRFWPIAIPAFAAAASENHRHDFGMIDGAWPIAAAVAPGLTLVAPDQTADVFLAASGLLRTPAPEPAGVR